MARVAQLAEAAVSSTARSRFESGRGHGWRSWNDVILGGRDRAPQPHGRASRWTATATVPKTVEPKGLEGSIPLPFRWMGVGVAYRAGLLNRNPFGGRRFESCPIRSCGTRTARRGSHSQRSGRPSGSGYLRRLLACCLTAPPHRRPTLSQFPESSHAPRCTSARFP